jgi:hypothetical protein
MSVRDVRRTQSDGQRAYNPAELIVQSRRGRCAGPTPEGAGFGEVHRSPPIVAFVVVEHGHRLQDGRCAAEMTQAPTHVEGLVQQCLCRFVFTGQDSQVGRQRAGRGDPLLVADAPLRRETPRRQGGRLCDAA